MPPCLARTTTTTTITYLVFSVERVLNSSLGVGEKILSSGEKTIVKEELAQEAALLTALLHESLNCLSG